MFYTSLNELSVEILFSIPLPHGKTLLSVTVLAYTCSLASGMHRAVLAREWRAPSWACALVACTELGLRASAVL